MSWPSFFIIFGICFATMLACRVVPLFLLKGKELPEHIEKALGFIPPAAFAALVANDLFTPGMLEAGLFPGIIPLIAALPVVLVAWFSRSLLWSVVTGFAAFCLLLLLVA